jgi:hypothetical protein
MKKEEELHDSLILPPMIIILVYCVVLALGT